MHLPQAQIVIEEEREPREGWVKWFENQNSIIFQKIKIID